MIPTDPDDPPRSTPTRPTSPDGSGLVVHCSYDTSDTDPPAEAWLPPLLQQAAVIAGRQNAHPVTGELRLLLVDDNTMSAAHAEHCGVQGTTDVITFDLREDPDDPTIDGDLILCVPEAQRQAARRGHEARLELLLYALHGLLHLLGEDDLTDDAYEQMHAREDAILTQLGFGRVFAP